MMIDNRNGIVRKLLTAISALFVCLALFAQTETTGSYGAYSPYSIYGLGGIAKEGTAHTQTMGGVGIASRNNRFINTTNPAAIPARDTLAFMCDLGMYENNVIYAQGSGMDAKNTFNVNNIVFSFPIWRSSAFMVGLAPFSDVGYSFSRKEDNEEIIANTGNITYDSYGDGSIYQLYVGAGATFWKRFSVGAQFIYYFGNIDRISNETFSNSSYRSINYGSRMNISAYTGKFGVQYEQKLASKLSMIVGATYRLGTDMRGYSNHFAYASQSSIVDTLKTMTWTDTLATMDKLNRPRIADEIGVGISFKGDDRWAVEFNYLRSDWRNSNFEKNRGFSASSDGTIFTSSVSQSFRAGFEIVPGRNDIRYYFRRCTYRGGIYYEQDYMRMNGARVDTYGLTFGMTLPVFRWYNGITVGMDIGRRGNNKLVTAGEKSAGLTSETYFKICIGFNIHDIWFQKPRYN